MHVSEQVVTFKFLCLWTASTFFNFLSGTSDVIYENLLRKQLY